jgi:hypothetical protein
VSEYTDKDWSKLRKGTKVSEMTRLFDIKVNSSFGVFGLNTFSRVSAFVKGFAVVDLYSFKIFLAVEC